MDKSDRKQYEKPKIERVELRIEEAVLAACKTETGTGVNDLLCVGGFCLAEIGS